MDQVTPHRKSIGLDLDGTLAQYDKWKGEEIIGNPIEGAIEFIERLSRDYDLYIFSARASTPKGRLAIIKWLKEHNIYKYFIDVTNTKQYNFSMMIDDRAIHFNNNYQEILKEIT